MKVVFGLVVLGFVLFLGDWSFETFVNRLKLIFKFIKNAFTSEKTNHTNQFNSKKGRKVAQKVERSKIATPSNAKKAVERMRMKFDHKVTEAEVINSLNSKRVFKNEVKAASNNSNRAKKITSNSDDELDAIRTQVINRLKK